MSISELFRTRSIQDLVKETGREGEQLKKTMGPVTLTALGVGAIIGTGIFVVIGEGAKLAGPAVILAFVLAGITCAFSALSYAELASAVPVSGSAYTFSYATLGELVAFIIGWDLILEYGVSVAAVAVGWGGNVNEFLKSAFSFELPAAITKSPSEGGVINVFAVVIVLLITLLLTLGTRESATINAVMVGVKIVILLFFIVVAFTAFSGRHFEPFTPKGIPGIAAAASTIFFAYIGFDAVTTASEETKKPARDLPIAIIGSLLISTVLYVLVSFTAVGIASTKSLGDSDAPLSTALREGAGIPWAGAVLSLGALIAITSVVLVIMYGQTRIFFAMCRDGLLPRRLARVSPRFGTPVQITVGFGLLISVLAALVPLDVIVELTNIGTLFAFVLVNIGVIVLRRTRPELERPFRVPFVPVLPIIGILLCGTLIVQLPIETKLRFVAWLIIGLVIYVAYSRRHSRVRTGEQTDLPPAEDA
ncbi:amino acid permease [uncultured Amnibacterium sp.]|uniref:amino acid permease n=1 Tax=uncultured Amnibacterium sp. TaxID=1631851 RepID=UPI0035CA4282